MLEHYTLLCSNWDLIFSSVLAHLCKTLVQQDFNSEKIVTETAGIWIYFHFLQSFLASDIFFKLQNWSTAINKDPLRSTPILASDKICLRQQFVIETGREILPQSILVPHFPSFCLSCGLLTDIVCSFQARISRVQLDLLQGESDNPVFFS